MPGLIFLKLHETRNSQVWNLSSQSYQISVVIPAYNVGAYIKRTISSVLGQSRPAEEIIVVDDGSIDDTAEKIQTFGSAIRTIRQENGGASVARNTGIKAARHEWIALLDGDDEWLPQHLDNQYQLHQAFPDLKWTSGAFHVCRCEAPEMCHTNAAQWKSPEDPSLRCHARRFFEAFPRNTYGHTSSMVIHRDLFQQVGLFDEAMPRHNDLDMWFRLAYHNPTFGFCDQVSAIYHRGIANSIIKTQNRIESLFVFLDKHMALSQEQQHFDVFKVCGRTVISEWLYRLLEDNNGQDMRLILERYKHLLNPYYYWTNRISSYLPRSAKFYYHFKNILKGRHGSAA